MTADAFAEFWRLQGYRVIETTSCFWYNVRPLVFMALPFHRGVTPSRQELLRVLMEGPSIAMRFLSPAGADGGLFLCSNRAYDLPALEKKARNQTRRGLENCRIEQLDFAYLAERGARLNEETCRRQGRNQQAVVGRAWRRYCDAAKRVPDFEAWGAFVDGGLGAYMVTALIEDHFSILYQSSATDALRYYPNNALTFTVTKLKVTCPQVACVSYGLKSPDYKARGTEEFKLNMGFELRPFGDSVVFNPLLKPFLWPKAIRWMARRYPDSDFWRRASGVLHASRQ
jgi:hypothetical protein